MIIIQMNIFNKKQFHEINLGMQADSLHNLTKNKLTIERHHHNHNYQQIIAKIKQLDEQNKKLVSISNNIMTTSFYKSQKTSFPTIISQMEIEMKNAFNELIASVQQYYVDIDTKIKDICLSLTVFENQKSSSLSQSTKSLHQNYVEPDKLTILTKKVQSLEENLKRTQQNQKNLISVIDKLLQKYQPTEQATLIRQDPILNSKIKNMKQINERKKVEKINNLSLDKNQFFKQRQKQTQRYHQDQYNKNQKSFHQQLKFGQNESQSYGTNDLLSARQSKYSDYNLGEQKCFIKKLYCKAPARSIQKVSLKSNLHLNKHNFQFKPRQQYIQQSNKTHREDYLLRNLKR